MFKKVLVANRGEIAVRVMRTCREMGISCAAVYSDADVDALHVRFADEAIHIGPGPATESYLNIDAVISAALKCGAQAIHPGYGFLSENSDFAEACASANLVFVGPSPKVLRLLGDKAEAKKLAVGAGVPVVPGFYDEGSGVKALQKMAKKIGFPVLIKAAFGGGGRGMRLVNEEKEFAEALEGARREARSSFGNDSIILEKHLERPRHIEVQIIGDTHGNLLTLGERECSVQRRYQKVIEETPSPAVTPENRKGLEQSALALAATVGYTNAGTVEFLLDSEGSFYFLEVNPRLQVEHPVTEWVTGLDLVRLQLLVAAGEPLPLGQKDIVRRGHSMEARVYAEDPAAGYLPGAGPLVRFAPPSLPWVRHDVGVYKGFEVPVYYDSLLAKVSVYGQDRTQATVRLREALDQYVVAGVPTNLEMLRLIARDSDFEAGEIDTEYVGRKIEPALGSDEGLPIEVLASAVVFELGRKGHLGSGVDSEVADIWKNGGPWRLGRHGMEYVFRHQGDQVIVRASKNPGTNRWTIDANDEALGIEVSTTGDSRVDIRSEEESWVVEAVRIDEGLLVGWKGSDYLLEKASQEYSGQAGGPAAGLGGDTEIVAPLPGIVAQVRVKEGAEVSARQTLVVLEAMKMEHLISAPYAGVVKQVTCREGMQVAKGANLLELEPLAD